MTVISADLVPNLVVGHKSDGGCVYDKAAKRQLAQRCLQPGVSLARIAMEHGVNANVLRKWVMQESSGASDDHVRALRRQCHTQSTPSEFAR